MLEVSRSICSESAVLSWNARWLAAILPKFGKRYAKAIAERPPRTTTSVVGREHDTDFLGRREQS